MSCTVTSGVSLQARPIAIAWHAGLPVFASESFLQSVGDEYGWLGGFDESEQLHCILPYTIVRKFGFRMVRFRVETIPVLGELDLEAERSFLNSAMSHFRSTGADMVLPAANTALFRTCPDGALAAAYGTVINDLTRPSEAQFSAIGTDHRTNIRKATKAGVQIKSRVEYLDVAFNLIAETLKRSDVGFKSHAEFSKMMASLGDNLKIFIAEHEGVTQAALVAPFSDACAYGWYVGSTDKPLRGAVPLLHWEGIRAFTTMGVKKLNFTGVRIDPEKGSKQEGIANYKKRFGGSLVQGYVWKYSFRPAKFAAYSMGMRFFKGGDIVDQEHNRRVNAA